jgi:hypothetical protein
VAVGAGDGDDPGGWVALGDEEGEGDGLVGFGVGEEPAGDADGDGLGVGVCAEADSCVATSTTMAASCNASTIRAGLGTGSPRNDLSAGASAGAQEGAGGRRTGGRLGPPGTASLDFGHGDCSPPDGSASRPPAGISKVAQ